MKIRAKANGNILTMTDEEAKELIATGIYEPVDDEAQVVRKDSTAEESGAGTEGTSTRGRHKRRDLRAEE